MELLRWKVRVLLCAISRSLHWLCDSEGRVMHLCNISVGSVQTAKHYQLSISVPYLVPKFANHPSLKKIKRLKFVYLGSSVAEGLKKST
jgi:hypothetical protein